MNAKTFSDALGSIKESYVEEAIVYTAKKKRNSWAVWGTVAACFAVLVIAGAVLLPTLLGGDTGDTGKYKYHISGSETDVEWPWEYKTNAEKYPRITFSGKEYGVKSLNPLSGNALGDVLGTCLAEGVDSYTGKTYTASFTVCKITGVSEERMVAIGSGSEFYVYATDAAKPDTFGEVLDLYGLSENLRFRYFTKCEGFDEKGYFSLSEDAYIWQILSTCRDAALDTDNDFFDRSSRNYVSFTATSEALGVYKRAVYISEDGYFATNIFNYSYSYFIGEEAAGQIISYALANAVPAEFSPYTLTVSGSVTEIADGYILIDDTVLCKDPEAGTVFKVYTDDKRLLRCLAHGGIQTGDTVVVHYSGALSGHNEVFGAYALYTGFLAEGDLLIPE